MPVALRLKENLLLVVNALVVGVVYELRQEGATPWADGVGAFLGCWLGSYVVLILVLLLVYLLAAMIDKGTRLRDLASHARAIDIVSPFISESGLELLLTALKGGRRATLRTLTRAEPRDVIRDVISARALERLLEFSTDGGRSVEIRRQPDVHAKLYAFDDRAATVGSAT